MDAVLHLVSTGDLLSTKYGFKAEEAELAAWPDETTKYLLAPEVKEMAQFIITKWRTDLKNINIAYVFKAKASKSNDSVTFGTAKTQGDLQRALHTFEAVVEIGFDTWLELELDQRMRLVDHELEHIFIDLEKNKTTIVPHPVEEFPSVIKRWGPANSAQVDFISAYNAFKDANTTVKI